MMFTGIVNGISDILGSEIAVVLHDTNAITSNGDQFDYIQLKNRVVHLELGISQCLSRWKT